MSDKATVWYQKLCEKHVREAKSLLHCANELDLNLTQKEILDLQKDKDFASCLRAERWKFYKELAADPHRTKQSAIGSLLALADRLTEAGQYDKAANVIMNIAKMEGWLDEKTQINVFGDLSQKDINQMREKAAQAKAMAQA